MGASPKILNSSFLNNKGNGIWMTDSSNPEIKNNIFKGNTGSGITCNSSSLPVVENNTFDSNSSWSVYLDTTSSGTPINNNTFINTKPSAGIGSGSLSANTTWTNDTPYIVSGTVTIPEGITLTVEPGAIIKFSGGSDARLVVAGTLIADGNDSSAGGFTPIIFTSVNDNSVGGATGTGTPNASSSARDWDTISFLATSKDSLLRHVIVKYGGYA